MKSHRHHRRRAPQFVPALLAFAAASGWGGAALAQTNPYYIGATGSVTRDSNVFRLPQAQSDTITSLGLVGGIDQPIGRQRIYGSGTVRHNRYSNQDQLNNTSYGLNAALDWSTINRLSGTVSYSANSALINYGGLNILQTTSRNIERSQQFLASVQYGMAGLLSLQGSLAHRSVTYSDPVYQGNGLTQNVGSAGVVYRPSAALSFGVALRATRGDYEANGGSFDRNDIDLTTTWVPSGLSTVSARLSYGRQNVDGPNSGRDFSGGTGYVSWQYQPTGKLQFVTWLSRETGAESGFLTIGTQQFRGVGDNSQLTTTAGIDANYAATGKIRLNGGLRTVHRSLVSGALEGSDRYNVASVGATYQALRNVQFSCGLTREIRSASGPLSFGYGASTATCSGQITLQ